MLGDKRIYHFLLDTVHLSKNDGGIYMERDFNSIHEFVELCKMDYRYDNQGEFVERILDIRRNATDGNDPRDITSHLNKYYQYRFTVSIYDLNDAIIDFCVSSGILKDNDDIFASFNAVIYKNNLLCTLWSFICFGLIDRAKIRERAESEYIWYSSRYKLLGIVADGNIDKAYEISERLIDRFTISREDISVLMDNGIFDTVDGFSIKGFNVSEIAKFVVGQDPIY